MALRNLRFKDDEILSKKAKEIINIDDKIKDLANDMLETMYKNDGLGLAACQVGILKKIIVYDLSYIEEGEVKKPVVAINPKITEKSKSMVLVEEGCLSFPNVFEKVKRHETVTVEYIDLDGNKRKVKAKDMEAVVLQHEIDHLDGIVFLDRK
jgi:peptide deformylase